MSAGVNAFVATYTNANSVVSTQAFVITGDTYTQFVYSPGGNKLAVVQNGALVKGTIPLPGGESAIYNASGLNYIRHTDWPGSPATGLRRWGGWLGSSRLATTWTHGVYAKEAYAPFGETYNEAGAPDRSFTGQDQDTTSGVYDFLFRKYDPVAGRWLSPDPAGWGSVTPEYPQSLDRYAYVQNNPNSLIDANGLECVWDDGSYDSADDVSTGNEAGCDAQGGTYIPPDVFEGLEGNQYGSWSGQDSSQMAFDWLTPSAIVFAGVDVDVYVYASILGPTLPDASYPTQSNPLPLLGFAPGMLYPGANGPLQAAKAAANPPGPPTPAPIPRPVPGPDPVPPQLAPGEIPEIDPGAPLGQRIAVAILNLVKGYGQNVSDFMVCVTCNITQWPGQPSIPSGVY